MARNVRLMLHPSGMQSESQFWKHVSELNGHGGLWSVGLIRKRLQHLEQASTVPFTCRRHKLGRNLLAKAAFRTPATLLIATPWKTGDFMGPPTPGTYAGSSRVSHLTALGKAAPMSARRWGDDGLFPSMLLALD